MSHGWMYGMLCKCILVILDGDTEYTLVGAVDGAGLGCLGEGDANGVRYWGFCREFSLYEAVGYLEGQGILGEAGDGQTGFCVIDFAVSEGADDGAEAEYVVGGGVHVNNHGR